MFLWRNTQNYPLLIKYPPYLFCCKFLAALPKRHQTAYPFLLVPVEIAIFLLQHSLAIFSMFSCSEAQSISMSFEYGENGEQESGVNTTIRSLVISLTCQYLPLTLRRSVRAQDEGISIQMYSLHQIKAKCGSTRSLKVKNLNSLCTVTLFRK